MLDDPVIDRAVIDDRLEYLIDLVDEFLIALIHSSGNVLGLSQIGTLRLIVLPQAVKNILPALCNEAIAVLKETSICGLVSVVDLTRAGDLVRSSTMSPYFTLISVAIVYFILVYGLSKAVGRLERRLAQSDRH